MPEYVKDMDLMHSFDAFYKNVVLRNNNLVIPYINLGVCDHPLNPRKEMEFIDFAYLVYINVSFLSVYLEKPFLIIDQKKHSEVYAAGGEYLDYDNFVFNDMSICCERAYLQTLDFSNLSTKMWSPNLTTTSYQQLDTQFVNDFFLNKYIPTEIQKLIE